MKKTFGRFIFAAALIALVAGFDTYAQAAGDEAAIKQAAQTMQEGWNKKDGKMFASPFAEKHDYININGLYLPNITRDSNARAHQGLFDGPYKEIDLQLRAAKVKFLSADVAVMHIQGYTHTKAKVEEKRQDIVLTAVLQRTAGKWEVVAFQNTPVVPTPGPPAQQTTSGKPKENIDAVKASPDKFKILLENENVRVVEYTLKPGEKDDWHTHPPKSSYVIAGGKLKIVRENGEELIADEKTGTASWIDYLGKHYAVNIGNTTVTILLTEVKR